jgi:hypothetical protein
MMSFVVKECENKGHLQIRQFSVAITYQPEYGLQMCKGLKKRRRHDDDDACSPQPSTVRC